MLDAVRVFLLVEAIGLAAAPVAGLLLARLPGRGLGFAKPLGLLLAVWLVWIGGSLELVPYGTVSAVGACLAVAVAGAVAWRWTPRLADPLPIRLFLWSEGVFAAAFAAMALVVSFAPDIWNTEKPMDMAFINAANESRSFPPHDPWMAGEDLNYYYLGHLVAAFVIRLTGVEPTVGYNLGLALTFALTAVAMFALAASLAAAARSRPVATGLAAVALCLVLGNLAGATELIGDGRPLAQYDWFSPSRVIPDTITEFPWFSFLLGDLHAHVLAIPFTLLALAFVAQVALAGPGDAWTLCGAAVCTGALYAINAWSYPVVAGLMILALLARRRRGEAMADWGAAYLAISVLVALPFHLSYDPSAKGIDLVSDHRSFTQFVRDQALIYGLFAWILGAAYVARLRPIMRRPLRNAAWLGVAVIFAGSLLAEHELAGAAGVAVALAVAIDALVSPRLPAPERALWLLIAGGLTCVLIPEVVYVRDEFDGGELFRMNTVFKLSYQGWLLLGLAAACALPRIGDWLPRRWRAVHLAGAAALVALAAIYPVAGTYARTGGFAEGPRLNGLRWLERMAPGDVRAIAWLRDHAPGDAVVLEAVGDDYSPAGHARISTFTGLATVMGWAGHELQWQHDPGTRRDEVRNAYASADPAPARALLDRYRVRYVVVGPIERADYGEAGIPKWDRLGRRVFEERGTIVWEVGA